MQAHGFSLYICVYVGVDRSCTEGEDEVSRKWKVYQKTCDTKGERKQITESGREGSEEMDCQEQSLYKNVTMRSITLYAN